MKVTCIHPRFAGLTSHHYNESHGLMREFSKRAMEFQLLMNINASAQLAAEFSARAVIRDPTFRMNLTFEQRSDLFLAMLHAEVDAELNADDRVLITVSTQLEAHALARWLQQLPPGRKPWIVVLMVSDRWNRSGRDEYECQVAEFSVLHGVIAGLAPEDARRLVFFAVTDQLAAELEQLLGTHVGVVPMPLEYEDSDPADSAKPTAGLPRIAVLGGTRREKGSYLLPDIVRACQSRVRVDFLVHLANNTLTAGEVAQLEQIADEPGVTVIRAPMSLPDYNAAIDSADIALFPYEVVPYRKRCSGVFAEAVARGKPVIATRGTWMAEQITAGRAAGDIFEVLEPAPIADAVARSIKHLDSLRHSARSKAAEWRRGNGVAVFVDLMEAQIAARSG